MRALISSKWMMMALVIMNESLFAEDEASRQSRKTLFDFVGFGWWMAEWFYFFLSATIIIKGIFFWNDGKMKTGTIWIIMGLLSFGIPAMVAGWTDGINTL